jgi:hypothetical protein
MLAMKLNSQGGLTSRVTIRDDELTILTDKFISVPDSLIEERHETLWVLWGTIAGHNLRRISDVRFMVGRIKRAIPAAWEHQLKADTVDTIGIQVSLIWQEVTVERSFSLLCIVETIESKGGLLKKGLGIVWSLVPVGLWDIRDRV